MNWSDINWEKSYSPIRAYAQSKLSNILFTKELAHRLKGSTHFNKWVLPKLKLNFFILIQIPELLQSHCIPVLYEPNLSDTWETAYFH